MPLHFHDCDRFRASGLACPYRELKKTKKKDREEDPEREEQVEDRSLVDALRIPLPGKREKDLRQNSFLLGEDLMKLPVIAHGDPEMQKALERMLRIQDVGGLPSIPNFGTGLPSFDQGPQGIMAILAAIATMAALNRLRSTGSNPSFQAVRASETQSARGLSRLSQSGLAGSRGGFGGIHTRAAKFRIPLRTAPKRNQELRRLLGFKGSKGSGLPGIDTFSETGFF